MPALPIHSDRNCQQFKRETDTERERYNERETEIYLASERKRMRERNTANIKTERKIDRGTEKKRDFFDFF